VGESAGDARAKDLVKNTRGELAARLAGKIAVEFANQAIFFGAAFRLCRKLAFADAFNAVLNAGRGAAFIVGLALAFAATLWVIFIEATLEPFTSTSPVLATLAFLAVLSVLIKDFFCMDIIGFPLASEILCLLQTPHCMQRSCHFIRRLFSADGYEESTIYSGSQAACQPRGVKI